MGWLLASLSGVVAAFTYPTVFAGHRLPNLGWMAFFAWVPLFLAVRKASPRNAFAKSFVASLFHYGIGMYWIYTAMNSFGGLSPTVAILALLLLVAVLSAYFGLIFWVSQWICRHLAVSSLWVRPFVWVGMEYLRGHLPAGGFPWSQIGYSQGGFLHFIQSADLFGVYGVTWLLVFCNEAIAETMVCWRQKRSHALKTAAIAVLFILANLAYGRYRLTNDFAVASQTLKVGVVQGNIPQEDKWRSSAAEGILETFQNGTMGLEQQGASLILWPEASLPYEVNFDAPELGYNLGAERADVLLGAITRSSSAQGRRHESPYYNTALLADAQGRLLGHYHKRHLVPFGEYVPWKEYLVFAKKLTAQVGELLPGTEYYPLKYRNGLLGVLICYEDIFPDISRAFVAKGAQVLINITNDAWYGRSSAAYQHQVFSQFRAVETRRALVRATNTGLSSQIDRQGRVLWQGALFTREAFLASLPFYEDRTFYVQVGDVLPIFSLILTAILGIAGFWKARRA